MRGRYYAKHTVNHMVDNQHKIKTLNENYKSIIKKNAIDYLKNNDICESDKVTYLKNLTHDVYRYGTKYKYKCDLSSIEISYIIRSINDDKLHVAYFGKTIKETNSDSTKATIVICVVFAIIMIVLLRACGS